jgi:hypothetical protein
LDTARLDNAPYFINDYAIGSVAAINPVLVPPNWFCVFASVFNNKRLFHNFVDIYKLQEDSMTPVEKIVTDDFGTGVAIFGYSAHAVASDTAIMFSNIATSGSVIDTYTISQRQVGNDRGVPIFQKKGEISLLEHDGKSHLTGPLQINLSMLFCFGSHPLGFGAIMGYELRDIATDPATARPAVIFSPKDVGLRGFSRNFDCNRDFIAISDLEEICAYSGTAGGCGGVYVFDCSLDSPSFGNLIRHLSSPDPFFGCRFGSFLYFWNNRLIIGQQAIPPSRVAAAFFEFDPSHAFRNTDTVYTNEPYYYALGYNTEMSQDASYIRAVGLDNGRMVWPYIIKLEPSRHRSG